MNKYTLLLWGVCLVTGFVLVVHGCDEAICGAIVSKCMLLKSCDACDMATNATCNWKKHCARCLSKYYEDCCPCVDLCKPKDVEDDDKDSSTVEDLKEPIPDLFNVLTEEEDELGRWKSITFPVMSPMHTNTKNILHVNAQNGMTDHQINPDVIVGEANCTVAFMSNCVSMRKCKASCQSMGATQYRWFHSYACCQCIGSTCLNYGLNKPKCQNCPGKDELDDVEREEKYMEEMNRLEINSDRLEEEDDDDDDLDEEN